MPVLFATALGLNALLIFWVQPLFAKMVLPLLGGSPSVWTTCMLFFQALLLALLRGAGAPVLLVRKGTRPGGLAPRDTTVFAWSLTNLGRRAEQSPREGRRD